MMNKGRKRFWVVRCGLWFGLIFFWGLLAFPPPAWAWWNSTWSYRDPVTITNSSGGTLTSYQVKVTVTYDSRMNTDFSDVRFVDSDDLTALSYWQESYTASTSSIFWVNVPSLTTGSYTVYMYFGNSSASTTSNGSNTFAFFDDFSGSSLDGTKWTEQNSSGGSLSIANSQVTFSTSSSNNYVWIHSNSQFTYPVWIEGKMDSYSSSGGVIRFGESTGTILRSNGNYYNNYSIDIGNGTGGYRIVGDNSSTGWMVTTTATSDTSGIWSFTWPATGSQTFYVNYASKLSGSDSTNSIANYYLYIGMPMSNTTGNVVVDWVRVRKFTSTEPTSSVGSTQTEGDIAVSNGGEIVIGAGTLSIAGNVQIASGVAMTAFTINSSLSILQVQGNFTDNSTSGTPVSQSAGKVIFLVGSNSDNSSTTTVSGTTFLTVQIGDGSTTTSVQITSGKTLQISSSITIMASATFDPNGATLKMNNGSTITVNSSGTFKMSSGTVTTPTPGTDRFTFTVNGTINITGGSIYSMSSNGLNMSSGATLTALKSVSFYNHPGGSGTDAFVTLAQNNLNLDASGIYFDTITLGCNFRVTGTGGIIRASNINSTTNGPGAGRTYTCDNDTDNDGLADSGGTVVQWPRTIQDGLAGTLIGAPVTAIDLSTFASYSAYIVSKNASGGGTTDRIYVANPSTGALKSYSYDVPSANGHVVCGVFWTTENSQHVVYFGTSVGKVYRLVDDATTSSNGTALTLSANWPLSLPTSGGTTSQVTSCVAEDRTNLYFGGEDDCNTGGGGTWAYTASTNTCSGSGAVGTFTPYIYSFVSANVTAASGTLNLFRQATGSGALRSALAWWQQGSNFYLFGGTDALAGTSSIIRVNVSTALIDKTCTGTGGSCTQPTGNVRGMSLTFGTAFTMMFFGDSTGKVFGVDPFSTNFANLTGFPFSDGTHTAPTGCGVANPGVAVPPQVSTRNGFVYYGDQDGHFYIVNTADGTKKTGYPIIPDTDTSACHTMDGGALLQGSYIYVGNSNGKLFKINWSSATVAYTWQFGSGNDVRDVSYSFLAGAFYFNVGNGKTYWVPR